MNDDVKRTIYNVVILFLVVVAVWVGIIFVNACGFSIACNRAERLNLPDTTPIPTMIPATLPAMEMNEAPAATSDECYVSGINLVGAWVEAGAPEADSFEFTDANGVNCEAAFEDVLPLFTQSNLWYSGSLSCSSCHSVTLAVSPAQLDFSSYEGILAGSRRADDAPKGTDILGGGDWESSVLYQFLAETKADVPGHDAALSSELMIYVGTPLPVDATPTP